MEGADKDSYAIPFLRVLQALSPQCDESAPEYVPGAKPGQLFNTVTGKAVDSVVFHPCAFQRRFIQWGARGADGGFKGEYLPEDVAIMRAEGRAVEIDGRLFVPDVNGVADEKRSDRLADTRSHFGICEDGSQVLLALSSTQTKKSKLLMSMLSSVKVNGATPPTWYSRILITTVKESNDQGSWHGVKFTADGFVTDPVLYAAGKAFHDAIAGGQVKANYAAAEPDGRF
jgi:hypothetical protein